MLKSIAKRIEHNYNKIIQLVNNFTISESDYIYGHVKEFIRLSKKLKKEAHRVISRKALLLCSKNKIYGSELDINGNRYDFEVFSDGNYRVIEVNKYKDISEEVSNEKYFKKNS